MQILIHFIGALILAYALSRLTRFVPLATHPMRGLVISHLLALVLVLGLVAALRIPLHAFSIQQVWQVLLAQCVWLLVDVVRQNWPRLRAL